MGNTFLVRTEIERGLLVKNLTAGDEAAHKLYVELVRESEGRAAEHKPLTKEVVDDAEARARGVLCTHVDVSPETVEVLDGMVTALRTSFIMG